jgi:hypothetical protein
MTIKQQRISVVVKSMTVENDRNRLFKVTFRLNFNRKFHRNTDINHNGYNEILYTYHAMSRGHAISRDFRLPYMNVK